MLIVCFAVFGLFFFGCCVFVECIGEMFVTYSESNKISVLSDSSGTSASHIPALPFVAVSTLAVVVLCADLVIYFKNTAIKSVGK